MKTNREQQPETCIIRVFIQANRIVGGGGHVPLKILSFYNYVYGSCMEGVESRAQSS